MQIPVKLALPELPQDLTNSADEWIRKPNDNPLFNGESARDTMSPCRIADFYIICRRVDGQHGAYLVTVMKQTIIRKLQ